MERYLIFSITRSGSTLLAESLYRCLQQYYIGTTYEYLTDNRLTDTVHKYLILNKNIKFTKLHVPRKCEKCIFLDRKDRIRQAISVYMGEKTKQTNLFSDKKLYKYFNSIKNVDTSDFLYRMPSILNELNLKRVRLLFHIKNIPHIQLFYEDIITSYEITLDRCISFLFGNISYKIPDKPTKKLSTILSDVLYDNYMRNYKV